MFARAVRVALTQRGMVSVAGSEDPETELLLTEWSNAGDDGAVPLYQRLAERLFATEIILLTLAPSGDLSAEWHSGGLSTVGGASLALADTTAPPADIVAEVAGTSLVPQLLGFDDPLFEPRTSDYLSFLLPGFGHLAKGYVGRGLVYGFAGASLAAAAVGSLAWAGIEAVEAEDARNNELREYHLSLARFAFGLSIAATAGYVGLGAASGLGIVGRPPERYHEYLRR